MGDFNFREISYKDNSVSAGPAAAASRFYNMIQDEFITQYVLEPTRKREGHIPSVLDFIMMNEEDLVKSIDYEPPVGKSDHVVLTWKVTVSITRTTTKLKKLNYWKGNYADCIFFLLYIHQ